MQWKQCRDIMDGRHDHIINCTANDSGGRIILIHVCKGELDAKISVDFEQWMAAFVSCNLCNWLVVRLEEASPLIEASILNLISNIECFAEDDTARYNKTFFDVILDVIRGMAELVGHDCIDLCEEIARQGSACCNPRAHESEECSSSTSDELDTEQNEKSEDVADMSFLNILARFESVIRSKFLPNESAVEIDLDLSRVTVAKHWKESLSSQTTVRVDGIVEEHFSLAPSLDWRPNTDLLSVHVQKQATSHHLLLLQNTLTDVFRKQAVNLHHDPDQTKSLAEQRIDLALSLLMLLLRGEMCLCGRSLTSDCEDSCGVEGRCLQLLKLHSNCQQPEKTISHLMMALARLATLSSCGDALLALDPPPLGSGAPYDCAAIARGLDHLLVGCGSSGTRTAATSPTTSSGQLGERRQAVGSAEAAQVITLGRLAYRLQRTSAAAAMGSDVGLAVWAFGLDATELQLLPPGSGLSALQAVHRQFLVGVREGFKWVNGASITGANTSRISPSVRKPAYELGGSYLAWHGAPAERWHGILRRGLCVMSGRSGGLQRNGAARGAGIYLARQLSIALGYAPVETDPTLLAALLTSAVGDSGHYGHSQCSTAGWMHSVTFRRQHASRLNGVQLVGLFEVAGRPEDDGGQDQVYLVAEAERVQLRILIALDARVKLVWGDVDAAGEGVRRDLRRLDAVAST